MAAKKKSKKAKKPLLRRSQPSLIINSNEDIDRILGLPPEPIKELKEKRLPKTRKSFLLIKEKPFDIVQKELETKKSQLLDEIKRQGEDEQKWVKARDQMKRELEALLEKKKQVLNEVGEYREYNSELLKNIKNTTRRLKKEKAGLQRKEGENRKLQQIVEMDKLRMEEKRRFFREKEKEFLQKEKTVIENENKFRRKEDEFEKKDILIKSELAKIKENKARLLEIDKLQKDIKAREKRLEKETQLLNQKEEQTLAVITALEEEKDSFKKRKQEFIEKDKLFIEREQMFVAKNKEIIDKIRKIEKTEIKLEKDIAELETKKERLREDISNVKLKEAMLRAEAKENKKELISFDKEWMAKDRQLDIRSQEIRQNLPLLKSYLTKIENIRKKNLVVLRNIGQKEEDLKKYTPTIRRLDEKYSNLKSLEQSLIKERKNLVMIRNDIEESRRLLEDEEKSIITRVNQLEKDESMLRKRETGVVRKVEELEDNNRIIKVEEAKLIVKLKDLGKREKDIGESERNLKKAKKIVELDFDRKANQLTALRKEWVSIIDKLNSIKSDLESEKIAAEDISAIKEDIAILTDKELEITRTVKQMEILKAKLEKSEERVGKKEQKLRIHEQSVKAREKDINRKLNLNMKLSDKRDETKSIIKKLPRLKGDLTKLNRQYKKEAAKLEKVTTESVAKREMLKDFEAQLKKKDQGLKDLEESLNKREQLLVNMEYNILKEEDKVEDIEFRSYMERELKETPMSEIFGEEEPRIMLEEEDKVLPAELIPKCSDNISMLIKQARSLIKKSEIAQAEDLCNEIERITKEKKLPKEKAKKMDYDLMELKTEIKLAKLV